MAGACSLPNLADFEKRTSRIYRVAELVRRYQVEEDVADGCWRVRDTEGNGLLPHRYDEQERAMHGASLAAACDILAFSDEEPGR